MAFLIVWFSHVEELLLKLGWWVLVGLLLCTLVHWLIPSSLKMRNGAASVLGGLLVGIFLPICNCGVIPLAVSFKRRGWCVSFVTAFYLAAIFINPATILASYGLMGPKLTGIYLFIVVIIALVAACFVNRFVPDEKREISTRLSLSNSFVWSFRDLGSVLAMWCLLGILIEGFVMTAFPASLFQSLMAMPENASPLQVILMGISRYACIPDDVPFVASLSAAGMVPSCTILLLLFGIMSNIPELMIMLGMLGKKITGCLVLSVILFGGIAASFIHAVMDDGFMPLMDLSLSGDYLNAANILTLGIWSPARSVCALLLVVLGVYGINKLIIRSVH